MIPDGKYQVSIKETAALSAIMKNLATLKLSCPKASYRPLAHMILLYKKKKPAASFSKIATLLGYTPDDVEKLATYMANTEKGYKEEWIVSSADKDILHMSTNHTFHSCYAHNGYPAQIVKHSKSDKNKVAIAMQKSASGKLTKRFLIWERTPTTYYVEQKHKVQTVCRTNPKGMSGAQADLVIASLLEEVNA